MVSSGPGPGLLGTRLSLLLELYDAAVAEVYADLGLPGFRPRFTPVVRVIAAAEECSIRDIANATGVTHSAASQTVARMAKVGLVTTEPGQDARTRMVTLTEKARDLLPTLEAEYAATTAAAIELERELSMPLSRLLDEMFEALGRRPMRQRIVDADPTLIERASISESAPAPESAPVPESASAPEG
jgi:DNA-binding MarR family transcriptional regulator